MRWACTSEVHTTAVNRAVAQEVLNNLHALPIELHRYPQAFKQTQSCFRNDRFGVKDCTGPITLV
jgi:hypothetical protein